jgi:tetratricopeptide (TPR) repeat protein
MTLRVPAGRLGMDSIEHNPVSYAFHSLMEKANVMRDTPEYMRDPEFKNAASPEKILDEARRLIDRAAQDGTLTPNQILVARIYLVLDNAPPEDLKKQSELLTQLFSIQSDTYINFVGQTLFFAKKRYRAAIECFKEHLKVAPADVNARLNLGNAAGKLGRFDEAESAADYVLDNKLGLNQHGYVVAYQVKAIAALGHHDYQKSISFAEKSFALTRTTFDLFLLQLAAARSGDFEKLGEASRKFEEAKPEEYQQVRLQVDAVTAYALVKNNQRDRARQLIAKWKGTDRVESKLSAYWGMYPGGSDVVKNWKELMPD